MGALFERKVGFSVLYLLFKALVALLYKWGLRFCDCSLVDWEQTKMRKLVLSSGRFVESIFSGELEGFFNELKIGDPFTSSEKDSKTNFDSDPLFSTSSGSGQGNSGSSSSSSSCSSGSSNSSVSSDITTDPTDFLERSRRPAAGPRELEDLEEELRQKAEMDRLLNEEPNNITDTPAVGDPRLQSPHREPSTKSFVNGQFDELEAFAKAPATNRDHTISEVEENLTESGLTDSVSSDSRPEDSGPIDSNRECKSESDLSIKSKKSVKRSKSI